MITPKTYLISALVASCIGSGFAVAPQVAKYQHDVCNCNPTNPIEQQRKSQLKVSTPQRTIQEFFRLINTQQNSSISEAYLLLAPGWKTSRGVFTDYWLSFDKNSIKIYSLVVTKNSPTKANAKLLWLGTKSGYRAGGEFTWKLVLINGQWKIAEVVG
jgi:hypothetical protein